MFKKKKPLTSSGIFADPATVTKDDPTRPYRDFLSDLATLYPVIRRDDFGFWISPLGQYRTDEVRRAAEAIRTARDKKATDALIKEFRSGLRPSSAGSDS